MTGEGGEAASLADHMATERAAAGLDQHGPGQVLALQRALQERLDEGEDHARLCRMVDARVAEARTPGGPDMAHAGAFQSKGWNRSAEMVPAGNGEGVPIATLLAAEKRFGGAA